MRLSIWLERTEARVGLQGILESSWVGYKGRLKEQTAGDIWGERVVLDSLEVGLILPQTTTETIVSRSANFSIRSMGKCEEGPSIGRGMSNLLLYLVD